MPFFPRRRPRSSISNGITESGENIDSLRSEHADVQNTSMSGSAATTKRSSTVPCDFTPEQKSTYSCSLGRAPTSKSTKQTLPGAIYTEPKREDRQYSTRSQNLKQNSFCTSFESSRGSTMSFGSDRELDSFVNVSLTGLSIDNSASLNSHYSYDPYTGKHEEGNMNGLRRGGVSSSTGTYLHSKATTRHLPHLTINSTKTKTLLKGPQSEMISPVSTETSTTVPCTPGSAEDEDRIEFGEFSQSQNVTPSFDMQFHPPHRLKEQSIHFSHRNNRDEMSSACSSDYSNSNQKHMVKANKLKHAALAEREYWKKILRSTDNEYGTESLEAARVLFNLGSALLRCKYFDEALVTYKRTVSILRQHYKEDSLIVAKALDKIGLSATLSPSQENLDSALLALHEAFQVRYLTLGPHHCDVVDTLNNIAGVYLHQKNYKCARDIYTDVLTVRVGIFGRNHPSVAITAQTLGKVFSHLADFRNALLYMELALTIYRGEPMALKDNHPLVGKVLKGITNVERLMDSFEKK